MIERGSAGVRERTRADGNRRATGNKQAYQTDRDFGTFRALIAVLFHQIGFDIRFTIQTRTKVAVRAWRSSSDKSFEEMERVTSIAIFLTVESG